VINWFLLQACQKASNLKAFGVEYDLAVYNRAVKLIEDNALTNQVINTDMNNIQMICLMFVLFR
jgi:hypothetical protein